MSQRPRTAPGITLARPAGLALAVLTLLALSSLRGGPPDKDADTGARPKDERSRDDRRRTLVLGAAAQLGSADPATLAVLAHTLQTLARQRPRDEGIEFWFNRRRAALGATAQLVGVGDPLAVLAMRVHGMRMLLWDEVEPDGAPELRLDWLAGVRDDKPFLNLVGKAPEDLLTIYQESYQEYLAYCQAVILADQTPHDLFAKSAAENKHVTFSHMYERPHKYRGKVIPVHGRLRRIQRVDEPPGPVFKAGVKEYYEGWVFLDRAGLPPVCVLFTQLPPGLKEGDNLNQEVSFDGYFFKKYRYTTGIRTKEGKNEVRSTLLFIAPTLIPAGAPSTAAVSPLPAPLLFGVIGFVAATIVLILLLAWWYRRNDRRIRSRLLEMQASRFVEQAEGFSSALAPPEPTGEGESGKNGSGDSARSG